MMFNKLTVIGNPPYRTNSNTKDATPIYHKFIESIIDNLNPTYFTMIIPSKWMCGGKGLDDFRNRMINDDRISKIVHFPGDREIFPSVQLPGGVSYFMWSKDYHGECEFTVGNKSTTRKLNEYDIIIQDNNAVSIINKVINDYTSNKVINEYTSWLSTYVLPPMAFKIRGGFSNWKSTGTKCYSLSGVNYCDKCDYVDRYNVIDKYKVVTSGANGAAQRYVNGSKRVLGDVFIIEPGAICTESYVIINFFYKESDAINFMGYMKTKFFRFLLGVRMFNPLISRDKFNWVPDISMTIDSELYTKFNLSQDEIDYIESTIRA